MDNEQLNYMGSLPSNTEPNPREQLNAINVQDEEGFVEPEPESRQETMVNRGQGELTLRVGDETITLQAPNSSNTSEIKGDRLTHSTKTNNMVQPTLQEMSMKEVHEPFSSNGRGPIHEERRLQIEELDEWRTHKPRTHDKPELRQNKLNTFPYQLKVGDKVLLDAADPHIVTTTPNEEIPLTVLGIFPFGAVEVSHPKFSTSKCTISSSHGKKVAVPASKKRKEASSSLGPTAEATVEQVQLAEAIRALLTTDPWELFFGIIELTYLELTMELCSTFHLQTIMKNYDDPNTVQFHIGRLVRQLSVLELGTALGLYSKEFKEENDLDTLNRHIHRSPSRCWDALDQECKRAPASSTLTMPTFMVLLITVAKESSFTLIGQMSPQGISSMLSMRMIEKHRGTYPPQYRLA
ncbi:hypothetical protein GOBAR_AA12079 [Gossypium barbadense]|uniref:Uncharacterized protein n=1 Tax=Gossypium barbadense TaxID=3634 RepID=A0A2P5XZ30_GOSBA|nr:hypothetical protein GOBAR_AA12079 [Gossypium barbadense]